MHGEIGDHGGQGTPRKPRPPDDDGGDEQGRSLMNLAALVFVILLVIGGVWLAKVLQRHARLEDCLMSGRTNCAPIDASH
jgi:hypothetical protein